MTYRRSSLIIYRGRGILCTTNDDDNSTKPTRHTYLHHEQQRVQNDQYHDEILEGRRHHQSPYFVLHAVPVFGHVPLQRSCLYGEIYAGFLKQTRSPRTVSNPRSPR